MLQLVITLLIIALIAGLLDFGGIAGTAVGFAKIIFVIAIVLFIASLIFWPDAGQFQPPIIRPRDLIPWVASPVRTGWTPPHRLLIARCRAC